MRILVLSSSLLVFLLIVPKPAQTQQSTTEEDAEETTTTEKPLSGPEAEFDQCCWDNFVNAQCGLGWCRYPPPVPEPWSPACMVVNNVISAYIPCYAQHKDNTACCVERGVEGKYQVCQDLCNGNATRYSYKPDYFNLCEDVKDAISSCNSGGGDSSTTTEETTTTSAQG